MPIAALHVRKCPPRDCLDVLPAIHVAHVPKARPNSRSHKKCGVLLIEILETCPSAQHQHSTGTTSTALTRFEASRRIRAFLIARNRMFYCMLITWFFTRFSHDIQTIFHRFDHPSYLHLKNNVLLCPGIGVGAVFPTPPPEQTTNPTVGKFNQGHGRQLFASPTQCTRTQTQARITVEKARAGIDLNFTTPAPAHRHHPLLPCPCA